jgi:hypothetical protein
LVRNNRSNWRVSRHAALLTADIRREALVSYRVLTGLLRAVIADMASNAPDGGAAVSDAADAVGRKQIVVGPEIYGICTLLIAGYILIRTGGKKATTRDIEISEDGNGKTMVRIREHTEFLNPFGQGRRMAY